MAIRKAMATGKATAMATGIAATGKTAGTSAMGGNTGPMGRRASVRRDGARARKPAGETAVCLRGRRRSTAATPTSTKAETTITTRTPQGRFTFVARALTSTLAG